MELKFGDNIFVRQIWHDSSLFKKFYVAMKTALQKECFTDGELYRFYYTIFGHTWVKAAKRLPRCQLKYRKTKALKRHHH